MLNARGMYMCIVTCLGGGEDSCCDVSRAEIV